MLATGWSANHFAALMPVITESQHLSVATIDAIFGIYAGLALRADLIDLETSAPQHIRGALTGVFYAVTYVGFGLPLLLTTIGSTKQSAMILNAMAVLAAGAAISRAVRLRRDDPQQH